MKKVLIVDDMLYIRMKVRKVLEGMRFVVVGEAENGEEAVEQYRTLRPDLVLLDVTMPQMNGLEALKLIMQINPDAKVIIVSGIGQEENVQKAMLAGAKNYIVKPFEDESLRKVLTRYR